MRTSRIACAARWKRAAPFAVAWAIIGGSARAAPVPPAGAEALSSARDAWDKGEFDNAEVLYKAALDQGQLVPKDTLDAYVHLGTARAVLGKKDLARAAFRQAARIDRRFAVPGEGGRRAVAIATLARHDEAKVGSVRLGAKIPDSVDPGAAFSVDATLDPKHVPSTAKIGIDARDSLSGKHYAASSVASAKVHFDVPAEVTLPGATLVVRIDALDAHDNRLASHEQRVHVTGDAPAPQAEASVVAVMTAPPVYSLPTLSISLDSPPERSDRDGSDRDREHDHKSGGFWSSPWPYVIGGIVLAGAGAAVYFGTRPSADVALGAPRFVTQ